MEKELKDLLGRHALELYYQPWSQGYSFHLHYQQMGDKDGWHLMCRDLTKGTFPVGKLYRTPLEAEAKAIEMYQENLSVDALYAREAGIDSNSYKELLQSQDILDK